MKLQCKNKNCYSRVKNGEKPMFTVNLTVDESGDACESARKINGEYFSCCHCGDEAEWIDESLNKTNENKTNEY